MKSLEITNTIPLVENNTYNWKQKSAATNTVAHFYFLVFASLFFSLSSLILWPISYSIIVLVVGITISAALTISLNLSIPIIFFYYTFEGMIKILSNYNPIFHISGDILILILFFRSINDRSSNGTKKITTTPFLPLFLIFSIWIFVQFFNPLGLGILPSIAGIKVYFIPMLLLYFAYHHLEKSMVPTFFLFITFLGSLMATLTIFEYLWGQDFILSLHPGYVRATRDGMFTGSNYRPFGTTAVPGMPAVWMTLITPIAAYLLLQNTLSWKIKFVPIYFFLVCIPVLLLCQGRTSMLLFALSFGLIFLFDTKKILLRIVVLSGLLFFIILPCLYILSDLIKKSSPIRSMQMNAIEKRFLTLSGKDTYKESRDNPIPKIIRGFETNYFLGMGLSRMGAAGSPWMGRILNHPYINQYTAFWAATSWADNLYIAIFYETGFIGLSLWLFLFIYILSFLIKSILHLQTAVNKILIWTSVVATIVILISGMGSEGALYAPSSIFLWTLLGIGIKEATYASK